MIIAGEKFNSSIPKTFEMLQKNDQSEIIALAKKQEAAGAQYLDLNAAMFQEDELKVLVALIDLVQEHVSCGIMIDSPSLDVVKEAIKRVSARPIIINSVTLAERLFELMPTAREFDASVVALPIGLDGMPEDGKKRIENGKELIRILSENGIPNNRIFLDVLVETLAVNQKSVLNVTEMITGIKALYPETHMICGLSNISFGLPKRANINAAFLTAAVYAGLDSAIMDITNDAIRVALYAALAVAGRDEYCMEYMNSVQI